MHLFPKAGRLPTAAHGHAAHGQALDVEAAAAYIGPRVTHASLRWIPPSARARDAEEHRSAFAAKPARAEASTKQAAMDRRVYPNFGRSQRSWPNTTTPQHTVLVSEPTSPPPHSRCVPEVAVNHGTAAFASNLGRLSTSDLPAGRPSEEYCADPHKLKRAVLKNAPGVKWVRPASSRRPVPDERGHSGTAPGPHLHGGNDGTAESKPGRGHTIPKARLGSSSAAGGGAGGTPGPGAYAPETTWQYLEAKTAPSRAGAEAKSAPASQSSRMNSKGVVQTMQQRFDGVLASVGLFWDERQGATSSDRRRPGASEVQVAPRSCLAGTSAQATALAAAARADSIIRDCGASPAALPAVGPCRRVTPAAGPQELSNASRTAAKEAVNKLRSPEHEAQTVNTSTAVAARGDISCRSRAGVRAALAFHKAPPRWAGDDGPAKAWIPSSQRETVSAQSSVTLAAEESGNAATARVVYADGISAQEQELGTHDGKMRDSDSDSGEASDHDSDACTAQLPRAVMWRKLTTAVETLLRGIFGGNLAELPDGLLGSSPLLQAVVDGAVYGLAPSVVPPGAEEHWCSKCQVGCVPCKHSPLKDLLFQTDESQLRNTLVQEILDAVPADAWCSQPTLAHGSSHAVAGRSRRLCERDLQVASTLSVPEWLHVLSVLCRDLCALCQRDAAQLVAVAHSASLQPAIRHGFALRAAKAGSHSSKASSPDVDDTSSGALKAARLEQLERARAEALAQDRRRAAAKERGRARHALSQLRGGDATDAGSGTKARANADTGPAIEEYNMGRHAQHRVAPAFGSGNKRLAGPVPGGVPVLTAGQDCQNAETYIAVRVRGTSGPTGLQGGASSSKCAASDSDDSFVSWHSSSAENTSTVRRQPSEKHTIAQQGQGPPLEARRHDPLLIGERVISRRGQQDGRIVEVAIRTRARSQPRGPQFADANAGDAIVRPRRGRGVVQFAPPKQAQPLSKQGAVAGTQVWQQVADIARFGVRLPPTAATNPHSDMRLKQWVSDLGEGDFIAAAETFGQAQVAGQKAPTTAAWRAVEMADQLPGSSTQEVTGPSHAAAAVHGKDTPALRSKVKGGPQLSQPTAEAVQALRRKRAAEAQQDDWYSTQLHQDAQRHEQQAGGGDVQRAAFGRTVNGHPGPYNYSQLNAHNTDAVGTATYPHTPGPGQYPGAASIAVFEATGGKRAPSFSFAAPGAATVPERYAAAGLVQDALHYAQDPVLQALQAAQAAPRHVVIPTGHTDLDRPDRSTQPAFSFPKAQQLQAEELDDAADMASKYHARNFTGVEVEAQLHEQLSEGWRVLNKQSGFDAAAAEGAARHQPGGGWAKAVPRANNKEQHDVHTLLAAMN